MVTDFIEKNLSEKDKIKEIIAHYDAGKITPDELEKRFGGKPKEQKNELDPVFTIIENKKPKP